jgi:hypothetical protein
VAGWYDPGSRTVLNEQKQPFEQTPSLQYSDGFRSLVSGIRGAQFVKQQLAEELLAQVLHWAPNDVAKERPLLQAMASLKYDEYEQFSPGLRFVESLALWLNQFDPADRHAAYRFVKQHLVFCSSDEMDHLVETAYPDYARPILLELSAAEQGIDRWRVGQISRSSAFRVRQRQTLFLGLSDGARIDTFRRANPELNHEQIWQTHELSQPRVAELLEKLNEHIRNMTTTGDGNDQRFRSIVLLDDFSASGSSYYTIKPDGHISGKVAKFLSALTDKGQALAELCDPAGIDLIILIYVATEQAVDHLRSSLNVPSKGIRNVYVHTVQSLPNRIRVLRSAATDMTALIDKYYDPAIFDIHMQKGGNADGRYGYADCGLPVVLHHNTPNNSIALFWFYDYCKQRGLFPRVQRHREMS